MGGRPVYLLISSLVNNYVYLEAELKKHISVVWESIIFSDQGALTIWRKLMLLTAKVSCDAEDDAAT